MYNDDRINNAKIILLSGKSGTQFEMFFEMLIVEKIRLANDGRNEIYRISSLDKKLPPEFKENINIRIKSDDGIVLRKAFIDERYDPFSMIVQTLS